MLTDLPALRTYNSLQMEYYFKRLFGLRTRKLYFNL